MVVMIEMKQLVHCVFVYLHVQPHNFEYWPESWFSRKLYVLTEYGTWVFNDLQRRITFVKTQTCPIFLPGKSWERIDYFYIVLIKHEFLSTRRDGPEPKLLIENILELGQELGFIPILTSSSKGLFRTLELTKRITSQPPMNWIHCSFTGQWNLQ